MFLGDISLDAGFDPGGFSISDGYTGLGFDTSGLGDWQYDFSQGFPDIPSSWGETYSPTSVFTDGALSALDPAALEAQPVTTAYAEMPSSAGYQLQAQPGGITQQVPENALSRSYTALGTSSPESGYAAPSSSLGDAGGASATPTPERQNPILKALGFSATKDGTATDFGDPKTIAQMMKLGGVGLNFLNQLSQRGEARRAQAAAQQSRLQQQLMQQAAMQGRTAGIRDSWTPTQQAWADSYFNTPNVPAHLRERQYSADMQSPVVPGRGYAAGGEVEGMPIAGEHGALGYVMSDQGGQDDVVPINAAGGEYVWDADVVAALGDGNNAAGAAKLDAVRRLIREHKRAAPPDSIPPKAHSLISYLKEAEHGRT